jgi:hypothetical protein
MHEPFELPVTFKGEELLFPAQLMQVGYIHHFLVNVYGTDMIYKPDEQRNYRAMVEQEKLSKQVSVVLLRVVAETVQEVLK